jgi:hypothetical protein
MGQLPDDLRYADWVAHVFDHPIEETEWYWSPGADYWRVDADRARTVEYLTRLFRESGSLPEVYSADQIGQGLNYLISGSCSNYMHQLKDREVPLVCRRECILAFCELFEKCFSVTCSRFYGHLDAGPEARTRANGICYMFWDVIPLCARSRTTIDEEVLGMLDTQVDEQMRRFVQADDIEIPSFSFRDILEEARSKEPEEIVDSDALEDACLSVMERTLYLPHPACQESALHGLGHWQDDYPDRVEATIESYLESEPAPELREYAALAREGRVR